MQVFKISKCLKEIYKPLRVCTVKVSSDQDTSKFMWLYGFKKDLCKTYSIMLVFTILNPWIRRCQLTHTAHSAHIWQIICLCNTGPSKSIDLRFQFLTSGTRYGPLNMLNASNIWQYDICDHSKNTTLWIVWYQKKIIAP